MLAVDVKNIKKTFVSKQDYVEAVKDVSFQVKQGEIFGLLGPNGACLLYTSPSPRDLG